VDFGCRHELGDQGIDVCRAMNLHRRPRGLADAPEDAGIPGQNFVASDEQDAFSEGACLRIEQTPFTRPPAVRWQTEGTLLCAVPDLEMTRLVLDHGAGANARSEDGRIIFARRAVIVSWRRYKRTADLPPVRTVLPRPGTPGRREPIWCRISGSFQS